MAEKPENQDEKTAPKVEADAADAKGAAAEKKPKAAKKPAAKKPAAKKPGDAEAPKAAKKPAAKKSGDAEAPKAATGKRTKKKLAPEAEGTAAAATGVDKKAAEALKAEPEDQSAVEDAVQAAATGGKAKPARKAATTAEAKKPAAKKSSDKPAAKPRGRKRGARESGELVVVRAHAKYVRSSARKARLVCDQIRGKSVPEARALLAFSPRDVAEAWTKLLDSAVANAEHNHDLVGDDLKVLAVFADEGPTIKRFRPRAMGRATSIHKRTSHLSIQLTPKETR